MRATVTLDPDVCRLLIEAADHRGRPLTQVPDDAERTGLQGPDASVAPFKQAVFSLGRAKVDLTKVGALFFDLAAGDVIGTCKRSRKCEPGT